MRLDTRGRVEDPISREEHPRCLQVGSLLIWYFPLHNRFRVVFDF